MEILYTSSIGLLSDLGHVTPSALLDVFVQQHIVKCSLLPPIFDAPVQLEVGSFLLLLLVFDMIGIGFISAELSLSSKEVLTHVPLAALLSRLAEPSDHCHLRKQKWSVR